jgi:hypothetical protein
LRGANSEVNHQKGPRMGRVVKRAMKIHVFRPPPTFQVKYAGTPTTSEMRA